MCVPTRRAVVTGLAVARGGCVQTPSTDSRRTPEWTPGDPADVVVTNADGERRTVSLVVTRDAERVVDRTAKVEQYSTRWISSDCEPARTA